MSVSPVRFSARDIFASRHYANGVYEVDGQLVEIRWIDTPPRYLAARTISSEIGHTSDWSLCAISTHEYVDRWLVLFVAAQGLKGLRNV